MYSPVRLKMPGIDNQPWDTTMTIVWRDALSVGNDSIDADHRFLLSLINRLEQVLTTDQPSADLLAAIDRLRNYTHEHFGREERIMLNLAYAKYDVHKHAHGELIEQLEQVTRPIRELGESMPATTANLPAAMRDGVIELLRHWLLDHILKEDLKLKPLLAARSRSFAG